MRARQSLRSSSPAPAATDTITDSPTSFRWCFANKESAVKPLEILGIDHVLLLVVDLEKTLPFYERVAGCSIETRLPQYGMIELRAGCAHLDLVDISAPQGAWARPEIAGGRNVDHVALGVASHNASELRAHLAHHGVAIGEERVEDGRTSFYVRDPSGNTIELRSAPQAPRG